ncbi:hypothetical protein ACQR1Y_32350, partial [Bradyrhizobium sp. HKCCYLRH3099]
SSMEFESEVHRLGNPDSGKKHHVLETGDCLSLDCWAHTMRKALKIARSTPLCRKIRIAAIRDFPPTLFSGH